MRPTVSVIMPSYNHSRFIKDAIQSVLNQTFEDFELIIIDDGSFDDSQEIIQEFAEIDSRVKPIFHKKNMGIARTLNDGLKSSKGEFITFIASDDVWTPNKLEVQLEILARNEDLVVWSEGEIIDANGNPTGQTFTERHTATNRKKNGRIFEELLKGNFIFGSSMILKRKNLGKIKFDESLKYLNDYKFVVDLAWKYEYHFIESPLAKYRIHGGNTILSDKKGWLIDTIRVNKYFLEQYGDRISRKLRAMLHYKIALVYIQLGNKMVAKEYLHKIFLTYPASLYWGMLLVILYTNKNSFTRKVLRKLYSCQLTEHFKRYNKCELL